MSQLALPEANSPDDPLYEVSTDIWVSPRASGGTSGTWRAATRAHRLHLKGNEMEVGDAADGGLQHDLEACGCEIVGTRRFGALRQRPGALVDHGAARVTGVGDERRDASWAAIDPRGSSVSRRDGHYLFGSCGLLGSEGVAEDVTALLAR